MGANKREAIRKVLFVYVCVGVVFIALWTLIPTVREYSFLEPLFFFFLPAALVLPYVLIDAIGEGFSAFSKRTKKIESEELPESTESEYSHYDSSTDSDE
jgi:hypothetical protein